MQSITNKMYNFVRQKIKSFASLREHLFVKLHLKLLFVPNVQKLQSSQKMASNNRALTHIDEDYKSIYGTKNTVNI